MGLAVEEVIHHDDVLFSLIIRPRGDVAAYDPHLGDACVVKHDAEEGKAPIARRGRDEAAEQEFAVGVVVLDQRAGLAVSVLPPRPAPIRLVNIREDRTKTVDRRRLVAVVGAGHEEGHVGDLAPNGAEQPPGLNAVKMVPYVGLLNSPAIPPGGNIAGSAAGGACTNPVPSGVVKSAPRVA